MPITFRIAGLVALVASFSSVASAQVYVPDDFFEAYLEQNGHSDGVPFNNFVSSNVNSRTSLNVSGLGIASLLGLASFTSLVSFEASNNPNITNTNFDFDWLPDTLVELRMSNTGLTSLPNISTGNLSPLLEVLDFSANAITSITIPVSTPPPLRELYANDNLLTALNASRLGAALEVLECSSNDLTSLILNNSGLLTLRCADNDLTSIDVSSSSNLVELAVNGNDLTSLNISGNTSLQTLQIADNNLTTINVLANTQLQELNVSGNQLTGFLLLGQHPSLTSFNGTSNPLLVCIQVADVAAATAGTGQYAAWTKPATTTYSESCSTDFPYTLIPDPAFEAELLGQGIDTQGVLDGRVLTADIAGVTTLDVSHLGTGGPITDLTGIADFAALVNLSVAGQSLSSLNVTANSNLQTLDCASNNLASLDLSGNPSLVELACNGNRLTSLDVSGLATLSLLRVHSQQSGFLLSTLSLPTGATLTELLAQNSDLGPTLDLTGKTALATFDVSGNPNLACIEVDDAAAATGATGQYATWLKDSTATYFEDGDGSACSPVAVLSLTKTGTLDDGGDGVADVGDTIAYTFELANTGGLPLTNVLLTDPLPGLSTITCPSGNPIPTLAAGASEQCSASYSLLQSDIQAGEVINTATAQSDQTAAVEDSVTVALPGPDPGSDDPDGNDPDGNDPDGNDPDGNDPASDDSGCGCQTPSDSSSAALGLGLLALLGVGRRRTVRTSRRPSAELRNGLG